jgi:signal transduction histidine kinase
MAPSNRKSIKVLLVEDVEDDMFIIEDHLLSAEYENFELTWTDEQDKAIEMILSQEFDVVLLDHDLLGFTGMEILKEAREEHQYYKAIIFLSGSKDPNVRMEALKNGASGFLIKGEISPSLLELSILFAIEKADNIINLEKMVDERTNELRQAQKELVQKETLAKLGEMVSGMAHEINTPLGGGVTVASHLDSKVKTFMKKYEENDYTPEELNKLLTLCGKASNNILNNLQRAADLVQSFKRMSVDQSSQQLRIFSLRQSVEDVITSLQHKLKYSKVKIELSCPDFIELNSYPGIFSQIFTNLINNSLIHGYDENQAGTINIDITPEGDNLNIVYKDDGNGMDEDALSQVFIPFFTTKRNEGGSGLGSSIIFSCVQQLGGDIHVHSEPGKGVEFAMTLPATPPAPTKDD